MEPPSGPPPPASAPLGQGYAEFAAARRASAAAASTSYDDDDFFLPLNHKPDQSVDWDTVEAASMDVPIPATNVGYRLMMKMGWKDGAGPYLLLQLLACVPRGM